MGAGLALLVLAAAAMLGPVLWLMAPWSAPTPTSTATATATPTLTSTATATPISTAGWKTLANTQCGYAIKYPPEASVDSSTYEFERVFFFRLRSPALEIRCDPNPERLSAPQ